MTRWWGAWVVGGVTGATYSMTAAFFGWPLWACWILAAIGAFAVAVDCEVVR